MSGVSSLGVLGVPWHPQILTDQLTLSQPGGTDYANQIIPTQRRELFDVRSEEKSKRNEVDL